MAARRGDQEKVKELVKRGADVNVEDIRSGVRILDYIRESVDSLCRDGADAQYMQYLSKSRITPPQTRRKLI